MSNQNMETLTRVFNTLMLIETKGENTIIMGQCLQALNALIEDEKKSQPNEAIAQGE